MLRNTFRRIPTCAALLAAALASAAAAQEAPAPSAIVADAAGQVGLLSEPAIQPQGPVPGVLVIHDALGPDLRSEPYLAQLLAAGLAVLEVAPEEGEPFPDRVRRGLAALAHDPHRAGAPIGLLAFGAGARAALLGADQPGVEAQVLLYPGCAALLRDLPPDPPRNALLVIHGDEDPANPPAACAQFTQRLGLPHARRQIVYRGASYGWDFPSADPLAPWLYPEPGGPARLRIRPSPALTEFSAAQAAAFLSAALWRAQPLARR